MCTRTNILSQQEGLEAEVPAVVDEEKLREMLTREITRELTAALTPPPGARTLTPPDPVPASVSFAPETDEFLAMVGDSNVVRKEFVSP